MKLILIAAAIGIVALASFPYWASCDMKSELCQFGCEVRHFNSGVNKAACKGACISRKIACLAGQTIERSSSNNK
jgi:hypothetical protein